jgi:hypothetical protein
VTVPAVGAKYTSIALISLARTLKLSLITNLDPDKESVPKISVTLIAI